MTDLPRRKHPRLKDFDYSTPGRYFVTLCVKNRSEILSAISEQVVGPFDLKRPQYEDSYAQVVLSDIGAIVEKYILAINDVYDNVSTERFVIMPNHIHMIIKISPVDGHMGSCGPTLPSIIKALKRKITEEVGFSMFQRSFYEHIIRDKSDYIAICKYIEDNPIKYLLNEAEDY